MGDIGEGGGGGGGGGRDRSRRNTLVHFCRKHVWKGLKQNDFACQT